MKPKSIMHYQFATDKALLQNWIGIVGFGNVKSVVIGSMSLIYGKKGSSKITKNSNHVFNAEAIIFPILKVPI